MIILNFKPKYLGYALIFLALSQGHTVFAQDNETAYFSDVTEGSIPLDPKTHALDVALVDVNGDGALDAIFALEMQPNRLYINDGNGNFTWKKDVFVNENNDTEHVRVADMDNDGFSDVIFVAEDNKTHEYYLGNGDGTFRNVSDRLLGKSEGNGLDIGDVNGDGLPDIVIGNTGEGARTFIWLNDPNKPGYLIDSAPGSLPDNMDEVQSVKLFDADGDGDLDMVLGTETPPSRLYFNDGKGKFTEQEGALQTTEPLHSREVIVFDADKDGKDDIFFANLTSNGGKKERNPTGRLFINKGEGKFVDETDARIPAYEFSTYACNVIDYDRDGDLDIILSALKIPPFEAMQVQALKNDGSGKFSFATEEAIPKVTVERAWGIDVGDVNGDKIPDLMIGAWGDQVRLLLGK
ncbi:FG-GAP repeat domain-containing protein [Sphingobacterium mizutaii]|uniref:FG-GAP repeat domain-containing protein n=1 Tax=Sphingobacterium mizutaii TaxID=1010 RepID=UPI0028B01474|nr:VCBS repeat-containing protein [Sphingobacterium mizutaii]